MIFVKDGKIKLDGWYTRDNLDGFNNDFTDACNVILAAATLEMPEYGHLSVV